VKPPFQPADSPVELAAPNPWWPQIFRQETARLCHALHGAPDVIEHIGSTAVPGLAARPIIDIVMGAAA